MKRGFKDLPSLRTPLGRFELARRIYHLAWPLLSVLATLHRRTLARNTRVIAVVGSFGKSTTMRATHAALGVTRPSSIANAGSSVARAVLRIVPGQRHAVIEVGIDRPGEMAPHSRTVRPDVTVVTSIGSDHNRSFKTLSDTRAEKVEMVRALPADGIAVLNGDDPNVLWMRSQTRARVITFGMHEANDVRGSDIALDWPHGSRFMLHVPGESRQLRIRLVGKPPVYAMLAAVAVAQSLGLSLDQIVPALEALAATPGRLELVRLASGAIILRDDYKASLETVDAALDVMAEIPGRRLVVIGEIAEPVGSTRPIYRRMGERVGQLASRAIFLGGQTASSFMAGARQAGLVRDSVIHARDVHQVIALLRDELAPGDTVLIKGRDTQRLDRITLALTGSDVRCELRFCNAYLRCAQCPMLNRATQATQSVPTAHTP
ncbi:MAG: UDP-N-acetylmuramoyl-tripeptide--D-alanyl-D-alanine ligase [Anaerolineae bacterium]|nr:UDP-N-acetylmuramoyl-tripeptide--D-alanyl-D-alanine ligase [Gemmatimonadaceae bacterium]